jgi:hypothetical protein
MNEKSAGLTALIRAVSRAFNTENLDLPPAIRASYPELRLKYLKKYKTLKPVDTSSSIQDIRGA